MFNSADNMHLQLNTCSLLHFTVRLMIKGVCVYPTMKFLCLLSLHAPFKGLKESHFEKAGITIMHQSFVIPSPISGKQRGLSTRT